MAVIPYDKYEKISQTTNKPTNVETKTSANEEKFLSLDDQMKKILHDSSLSDVEKLHKYSEVMRKYLEYKDKISYDTEDKKLPREVNGVTKPYEESEDVVLQSEMVSPKSSDKVSDNIDTGVLGKVVSTPKTKVKNVRDGVKLADIVSNWISL